MRPNELETLTQLVRDDSVEWRDIPNEHQASFGLFARGITVSESPSGGALIPGRNWRAYLRFLRDTALPPDQVTEAAINAWCARSSL